ncbi:MAG: hypothetical protein HC819_00105 [Cyclobacteriaceae bacterium]|nr:hypothetical protein [Cyclobacteriaceae bacterium]
MSNDSTITLVFPQKFEDKASYLLTVTGVKDVFSNAMEKTDISFTYFASYLVDFNDLLITEIMADPSPGIDLPEYEYLEIFNPGTESYSVSNMLLVVGKDTAMMADFSILPGEYLIVCQSSAVDHFADFGRTMKVSNWPSLNNSGEPIALYNEKGKLVFSIAYDDSWYKSIEKDDGGWSLEMIDTRFPCKSSENWIASIDASGGTPGKPNAVSEALTDLSAPAISRVIVDSPTSAMVYLDEKIEPQAVSPDQVSVLPQLDILSILLNPQDFSSLKIEFATAILPNTKYELSIKNIHDCAGNVQKGTASSFVLPQMADSLDIIINEILFNPRPEGIDFVELYNQSDKYIDLSTLQIANDDDKKSITEAHLIIEPKQFVALTESAEVLHNQYPGIQPKNLLKVEKMPPFNDDEGSVILRYPDGKIVDFVQYADAYHSPFLNDSEGVSLERISFDSPSNKPDNWQSASATAGFATPGKINSQTLSGTAHSSPMHIEPPVFDPGGHGFPAFTIIKCRFANGGNMANLNIVDTQGRVVKTILSHQSVGVEEDFKWEGDNDEGQEVRLGPYIVFMEIYAADGSRHLYRKKVVVAGKRQ